MGGGKGKKTFMKTNNYLKKKNHTKPNASFAKSTDINAKQMINSIRWRAKRYIVSGESYHVENETGGKVSLTQGNIFVRGSRTFFQGEGEGLEFEGYLKR